MQLLEMALLLIVQDHDRARSDLAATLRAEGHSIIEAATAQAGTDMARTNGVKSVFGGTGATSMVYSIPEPSNAFSMAALNACPQG